jgi:lipopolysaccharide export system permease protein
VRSRVEQNTMTIDTYDNQIHKMFAIAFACVIFVFLGAPIALRFPRGGVGMVLGVSLGVFALYYIGLIAGEPLAQRGVVPPFLAMWMSNIVFGILSIILLLRMSKETGSGRGGEFSEMMDRLRDRLRRGFRHERRHVLSAAEGD